MSTALHLETSGALGSREAELEGNFFPWEVERGNPIPVGS